MENTEVKNLRIYLILTYAVFWMLLGFTGFLISLEVPSYIQTVMKTLCAWTPTFVLIFMFKRLYPKLTFRGFLGMHFGRRLSPVLFLSSFFLQIAILAAAVLLCFALGGKALTTMSFIEPSAVLPGIIITLLSGATGEELGWRGYVLNVLQKRWTPLKAGALVGLVWGGWHFPLMLLSGYTGMNLVLYIAVFMIAIVSTSVVITFFYNRGKNILIAMWVHFLFNFLLKVVLIDVLPLIGALAAGYAAAAAMIVISFRDEMLDGKS